MGRIAIGILVGVALTLAALFGLGLLRFSSAPVLPQNAPEFRLAAHDVILETRPACPLSTLADNDSILAPAKAELSKFRKRLDGGPYAEQFDIAEADAEYVLSVSQVECHTPDSRSDPNKLRRAALGETVRHVRGLEELLRD